MEMMNEFITAGFAVGLCLSYIWGVILARRWIRKWVPWAMEKEQKLLAHVSQKVAALPPAKKKTSK